MRQGIDSLSVVATDARSQLTKLGDVVEGDRDGNWRIVKTSEVEVVSEEDSELTLQEEKDLLQLMNNLENIRLEKDYRLQIARL